MTKFSKEPGWSDRGLPLSLAWKETEMKTGMAGRLMLACAVVLLAAAANGQGVGPGFGSHKTPMQRAFGAENAQRGWWNSPKMVESLKLTDDQRKAMDGIMLDHRTKLIDLRANLDKAELAMQPLMGADTPNDAAIIAQIDKVVQARGDLERANARFLLAIRDKLTPDQWKQLRALRDESRMHRGQRPEWRRDGRGPGPGPGGPGPDGSSPAGPGPGPGPGSGPGPGDQQ